LVISSGCFNQRSYRYRHNHISYRFWCYCCFIHLGWRIVLRCLHRRCPAGLHLYWSGKFIVLSCGNPTTPNPGYSPTDKGPYAWIEDEVRCIPRHCGPSLCLQTEFHLNIDLISCFSLQWLAVPFAMSNDAVDNINDHTDTWVGEWDTKKTGVWIDYVLFLVSLTSWSFWYHRPTLLVNVGWILNSQCLNGHVSPWCS
jgi:hypothetical protein